MVDGFYAEHTAISAAAKWRRNKRKPESEIPMPDKQTVTVEQNKVYLELRQIYCCKGAEFSRPTLEKAWKEIERLEVALAQQQAEVGMARKWERCFLLIAIVVLACVAGYYHDMYVFEQETSRFYKNISTICIDSTQRMMGDAMADRSDSNTTTEETKPDE